MMKLQVALFNWLQIYVVSKERPDDGAAEESVQFFETILKEDHQLSSFEADLDGSGRYVITYWRDDEMYTEVFDREEAERLWQDIEASPNDKE